MLDLINLWPDCKPALQTEGFIDEFEYLESGRWTTVKDAAAAVALAADGTTRAKFTTSNVDNNEAYIATGAIAKFVVGKPILIYARLQFAEANVDDLNVIFGLGEGFGAANTLQDDGAGPLADYDGACFFKVDGGTRWNFETSDGTTQVTKQTDKTAGGTTANTLAIMCNPISTTECQFTPWIDTAGGNNLINPFEYGAIPQALPIQHRHSWTAGLLKFCIGIKAGGATDETLYADLAIFQKKR